jgi:hypothetical protein
MWCLLVKKVPTWEVMKKRQIAGPGWCSLCKVEEESQVHLFLLCPFIKVVWKEISRMMGQVVSWQGKWWKKPRSIGPQLLQTIISEHSHSLFVGVHG